MPAFPAFSKRGPSIPGPSSAPAADQVLGWDGSTTLWVDQATGVTDHGALTGLGGDDHPQYALLAGRAGGQTIVGGTEAGDSLTIDASLASMVITTPNAGEKNVLTLNNSNGAAGDSANLLFTHTDLGEPDVPTAEIAGIYPGGNGFGDLRFRVRHSGGGGEWVTAMHLKGGATVNVGIGTLIDNPTAPLFISSHIGPAALRFQTPAATPADDTRIDWVSYEDEIRASIGGRSNRRANGPAQLKFSLDESEILRLESGEMQLYRDTSTTSREVASVTPTWTVSTDASRAGRVVHAVQDWAGSRETIREEADGTQAKIGFLGADAVARPDVTGSRTDGTALASLITALASLGLITDSTTA